jgi:hypothetical protein
MQCSKPQLFDYLVGQLLKMQGHVEAKRLGGLQVDDQLELGRLQHRQGANVHDRPAELQGFNLLLSSSSSLGSRGGGEVLTRVQSNSVETPSEMYGVMSAPVLISRCSRTDISARVYQSFAHREPTALHLHEWAFALVQRPESHNGMARTL